MNVTAIIIAALVVGAVGIILGFFLGISGEKFKVEVDPREEAILEVLPGNNCGGCGYAGCSGLAAAIVKGEAPVGQCPVGGDPVAAKVSEIMGVKVEAGVKKVAFVKCAGTCDKANTDYDYTGVEDCVAMSFVPGGGQGVWNWKHDVTLNGALGDARKATAEIGEAMTNEVLDYLERLVDKIIDYKPTPEKLFK